MRCLQQFNHACDHIQVQRKIEHDRPTREDKINIYFLCSMLGQNSFFQNWLVLHSSNVIKDISKLQPVVDIG